jgi:hypothetical protein
MRIPFDVTLKERWVPPRGFVVPIAVKGQRVSSEV